MTTFVPDALTMTRRNIITIRRVPQLLVFATIQPIIFVLLFRYVFGGAIPIPGVPYVDYLMPGIFAQTVAFGAITTGVGLAEDTAKGLIERFRSLPMARSAVLVGRTVADLCRNVFVTSLMVIVGIIVGYRFHAGLIRFLARHGAAPGVRLRAGVAVRVDRSVHRQRRDHPGRGVPVDRTARVRIERVRTGQHHARLVGVVGAEPAAVGGDLRREGADADRPNSASRST